MSSDRVIRTPDQRVRVFVSSTLGDLAPEREAVRSAVERLRLAPVMFEHGARPHPPRDLYRAYLAQSHVFVGLYWQRYGWVAPGEAISGLEDEYRLAGDRPRLLYIKEPAPEREERLATLIAEFKRADRVSYKRFSDAAELADLVADDLALLLTERFERDVAPAAAGPGAEGPAQAADLLPTPLTPTVGRADQVASILHLLASGSRLVTLTGPGGVGKTRVALEVARGAATHPDRAVRFVALAAVTRADLVVRSIADLFSLRAEGSRTTFDVVVAYLAAHEYLLVLDNLEQIPGVATIVRRLLEHAPSLQVLATSRHALRLDGERIVSIAPLRLPSDDGPPERLAAEPAVRLFVERARAVAPGLVLDDGTLLAVAQICRRLDGLPLAIELVAARSRVMPPTTLLQRLERSSIVGGGGGDRPQRHRSLRATIAWSFELLDEAERSTLERLAVFVGGFDLEGAAAVLDADEDTVLERVTSLVDKSLLDVGAGGVLPRFAMLETVRAFAWERLAGDEAATVRRSHLEWYRRLADAAQPFLCGPHQREWAARLDPERANLRAAAATALALELDEAVIEFVWDLYVFYEIRDAVEEPETWLRAVRDRRRVTGELPLAKQHAIAAWARIARGDHDGLEEDLASSLVIFEREDLRLEAAVVAMEVAHIRYVLHDDVDAALAHLDASARHFAAVRHDWGGAMAETMRASILALAGDTESAERHVRRALTFAAAIDNDPLVGRATQQLALVRVLSGDPEAALPLVSEAAALLRRGGYQTDASYCLDTLAAVALARGDAATASRAAGTADRVRAHLGAPVWATARRFSDSLRERARAANGTDAADDDGRTVPDVFAVLEQTLAALATG